MEDLVQEAERIDPAHGEGLSDSGETPAIPPKTTLSVKSSCGFSATVLNACNNLGLQKGRIESKNVTDDPAAADEREQLTGKRQAPCLVVEGQPKHASVDIMNDFVTRTTGLCR
jgi:glutaredoxin